MTKKSSVSLREFREALRVALRSIDPVELQRAWQSQRRRTTLYKQVLIPRLEEGIGAHQLRTREQWGRFDWSFWREKESSPAILLESENQIWRVLEELHKFCVPTCPGTDLRVILTVGQWDEGAHWSGPGSLRKALLPAWRALAEVWLDDRRVQTTIVVYVAEMTPTAVFQVHEEVIVGPEADINVASSCIVLRVPMRTPVATA